MLRFLFGCRTKINRPRHRVHTVDYDKVNWSFKKIQFPQQDDSPGSRLQFHSTTIIPGSRYNKRQTSSAGVRIISWPMLQISTSIVMRIVSRLKYRDTYRIVRVPYRYNTTCVVSRIVLYLTSHKKNIFRHTTSTVTRHRNSWCMSRTVTWHVLWSA